MAMTHGVAGQTVRNTMTIKLMLNGTPDVAVLEDNVATDDFFALLPLGVKLEDYAVTEKLAGLPP